MHMRRVRKSKQRDRILEYLRGTGVHPTAQKIYEDILPEFPSLSLGTVYRNLAILEEQGQVRKLQYGSTFDRYDAETDSHYHFICKRCGGIYDLPVDEKLDIERIVARSVEHRIEDHEVDFYGICSRCLARETDKAESRENEESPADEASWEVS